MREDQFNQAVNACHTADRRRAATSGVDPTIAAQTESTKRDALNGVAALCHPYGLHLLALDQVYSPGTDFRWGSPIAERLASEVSREGSLHPLVGGLNTSAERIELALKAVSQALGLAAQKHPAGASDKIWLDT
jgi:hypothetical protein